MAAGVVSALVVSGCASIDNPGVAIAPMAAAGLPSYAVGDLYVYSDGYIEEVLGTSGDRVQWALGHGGVVADKKVDFTHPALHWSHAGVDYGFHETSVTGALWPLRVGASVTIRGAQTAQAPEQSGQVESYDEQWRCSVPGAERLTLSAGVFDTFVVDCERRSASGAHWQHRRLNYAPNVGHYVRSIEEMRTWGQSSHLFQQRDLALYRPHPSLDDANRIEHALRTLKSGESDEWEGTSGSRRLQVLSSAQDDAGHFCRSVSFSGLSDHAYVAQLCHIGGRWVHQNVVLQPR